MKAKIRFYKYYNGYAGVIEIDHPLLDNIHNTLITKTHSSKGQIKRKLIQFCDELNLSAKISE